MAGISVLDNLQAVIMNPLTARPNQALRPAASPPAENAKIEKSAKDFESILLGNWLQQAEQSFGSLPGGDDDDEADSGKDQFMGMAMQSLGVSMTTAGGIGIAKLISKQLHKADDAQTLGGGEDHPGKVH